MATTCESSFSKRIAENLIFLDTWARTSVFLTPQSRTLYSLKMCSKLRPALLLCHRYRGTSRTATVGCVYRRGEVYFISVLHSSIDMCNVN